MVMVKTVKLNVKLFVMETHLLGKSTQLQVDKNKKIKIKGKCIKCKSKRVHFKRPNHNPNTNPLCNFHTMHHFLC